MSVMRGLYKAMAIILPIAPLKQKALECDHCWNPRFEKVDFISHSGKEWSENVLKWHNGSGGIQIRSAKRVEVGPVDHHGYSEYKSYWKSTCCKCGAEREVMDKYRAKNFFEEMKRRRSLKNS
jgi:hypothetical protein